HVVSPRIMYLRDHFVGDYRTIGRALGAGVILVLLIACANVAGTMLARSIFRRREIGIRMALGASGSRIARQLLTESLALAAIASVLLASGGLLLRAYAKLRDVDPGFRPDGVATFRLALPSVKYPDGVKQAAFYQTLIDRVRSLPGVTAAGAITCPPFGCHWG